MELPRNNSRSSAESLLPVSGGGGPLKWPKKYKCEYTPGMTEYLVFLLPCHHCREGFEIHREPFWQDKEPMAIARGLLEERAIYVCKARPRAPETHESGGRERAVAGPHFSISNLVLNLTS